MHMGPHQTRVNINFRVGGVHTRTRRGSNRVATSVAEPGISVSPVTFGGGVEWPGMGEVFGALRSG